MRKYLLLAGFLAVLTCNNANARQYYEDEEYYVEQPRYERQYQPPYRDTRYVEREESRYVRTSEPRYREVRYAEQPRYRRVNREDEVRYVARNSYNQNKVRPYIGLDVATVKAKYSDPDEADFLEDSFNNFTGVAGLRINRNFGLEAF